MFWTNYLTLKSQDQALTVWLAITGPWRQYNSGLWQRLLCIDCNFKQKMWFWKSYLKLKSHKLSTPLWFAFRDHKYKKHGFAIFAINRPCTQFNIGSLKRQLCLGSNYIIFLWNCQQGNLVLNKLPYLPDSTATLFSQN